MAISSAKKQIRLRQRLVVLPVNVISLCLQSSSASRVTAGRGDRGRDRRVAPRPVEAVAPRFELSQRSIEGLAQNEEPGLDHANARL